MREPQAREKRRLSRSALRLVSLLSSAGEPVEDRAILRALDSGRQELERARKELIDAKLLERAQDGTILRPQALNLLAVPSAYRIVAWGYNGHGQLGDGTLQNRPTPVPVQLGGSTRAIAMGPEHSLAISDDVYHYSTSGQLNAWGSNGNRTLGNGSFADSQLPVPASGVSDAIACSGGWGNSLSLRGSGGTWVSGIDMNGSLGGAATGFASTPVKVPGLPSKGRGVAVGQYFNVVVDNRGRVWTWGENANGQLGRGSTSPGSSQPKTIRGVGPVTAVAAGTLHALALLRTGNVSSWGLNNLGQLGDGTAVDKSSPVAVQGLPSQIKAIAAGGGSSMALAPDGSVWVWGTIRPGSPPNVLPIKVAGLTGITAIAMHDVGLAVKDDGTVWRMDYYGASNALQLSQVAGIVGARAVAAGSGSFMALCRGRFEFVPRQVDFGQVQVGSTSAPVTVTLSNIGSVPIELWTQPFSGTEYILPGYAFSLTGSPPAVLAPGAATTFSARFKPTSAGNDQAWPLFVFDCGLDRLELSGEAV